MEAFWNHIACYKLVPYGVFHPGDQHLWKFIATKANLYLRRFISHRIGLGQQHSYRFIKKTDFIGETQLLVNQ